MYGICENEKYFEKKSDLDSENAMAALRSRAITFSNLLLYRVYYRSVMKAPQ